MAPTLEKDCPDSTSEYAKEGTQAHEVCELLLKNRFFGEKNKPDGDAEMLANAEVYVDYIEKIYNAEKAKGCEPILHIEEKLNLSDYIPRCFGYADAVLEGAGTLHVFDFKYGKGVRVDAEENPQLKIYALGAERLFNCLDDFDKVQIHIVQPRIDNIDAAEYSVDELVRWGNEELKPAAIKAYKGEGQFKVGSHCQFCRASKNCRVRSETLIKQIEDAKESNAKLSYILTHADEWMKWIKSMQESALEKAIDGEEIPGFKLVEGRSNRKIQNPEQVAEILKAEGVNPYKPTELKPMTALEREVGKKKFTELCGAYLIKPQGKPALVPESDRRPALDSAQADFDVIEGD